MGSKVSAGGTPDVQQGDEDVEKPVDFFCDDGGAVRTSIDSLTGAKSTPVQVHHDIKAFLEDDVRLASPKRIQAFVRVISNVNSRNTYWVCDLCIRFCVLSCFRTEFR